MTRIQTVYPLLIVGSALEIAYVAMLLISRRFHSERPVLLFLAIYGIGFLIYILSILLASRGGYSRAKLRIVFAFAVLFRLTLLPSNMILENDIYRYLWDGAVTANGMNPFEFAPETILKWPLIKNDNQSSNMEMDERGGERDKLDRLNKLRDAEFDFYLRNIGYAEVPTIYPPSAQMLFALSYFAARPFVELRNWMNHLSAPRMQRAGREGDGNLSFLFQKPTLLTMKGVFVILDLIVIILLIDILKKLNLSRCNCIIYAWSPLVMKEFANSGHYDVFPICMVMLVLWLILRRRGILSAVALSIGALAKLFPIVLLFPLAKRIGWKGILVFVLVFVSFYVPFLGVGVERLFSGLGTYASRWEFNSGLFTLVEKGVLEKIIVGPQVISFFDYEQKVDAFFATKIIMSVAMLVFLVYIILRKRKDDDLEIARAMFFCIGVLLLLSPVMDAWYLCWIIPLLCIFPRPSWIMLTGLAALAYMFFMRDTIPDWWVNNFEAIAWRLPFPKDIVTESLRTGAKREELYSWWMTFGIRFFEYIPFFALLLVESGWRILITQRVKILTMNKEDNKWQL